MGLMAWISGITAAQRRSGNGLSAVRGGIDLITPSLVSGWVQHPDLTLVEVRLLVGQHLFAQALIQEPRPDVEEHIGVRGHFGFRLVIPADLPLLNPDEEPRLLALTADGSQRLPLTLQGNPAATVSRLRAALAPQHRGLCGHFDGFSADGTALQGWCYSPTGGVATVWLQADGLPPHACTCDQYRPGMADQGHSEWSGFCLPLSEWPEAAGRQVWASFDEAGELRLPQPTLVELPRLRQLKQDQALPLQQLVGATTPAQSTTPLAASVQAAAPLVADPGGVDLQAHWQALEHFRQLLDQLEGEVQEGEFASLQAAAQPTLSSLPSSRSARFRLWR
jgi:hypothetical protein